MIKKRGATFALVAVLAAVGACQSNGDDSSNEANGGGGSANADAGAAGGTADGGAAQTAAGNGSSGSNNAGTGGHGGTSAGTGGSAGNAPNAGTGGTPSAAGSGEGGADDGAAGEAGSGGFARAEFAYLTTYLGGIFAFSLDPVTGTPKLLPGSPVEVGAQVYAVSVDPSQRHLYVAKVGQNLDVFTLNADGSLPATPSSSTQTPSNTLALDPKGRFAFVATGTDDFKSFLQVFKLDADSGALTSAGDALQVANAPAYIAVDPSGRFAYVTAQAVFGVWAYAIDQTTGLLTQIGTQPFGGNAVFAGAIAFRPDGKFLYTSGNGLNAFAIDSASGGLTRVGTAPFNANIGSDPSSTNLAVDPRGKFLYATQFVNGERFFAFSIDGPSGAPTAAGTPLTLSEPYCVGVEPSGRFAYVGRDDGKVSAFAINQSNGTVKEIDGSPVDHGGLQPEIAFAAP